MAKKPSREQQNKPRVNNPSKIVRGSPKPKGAGGKRTSTGRAAAVPTTASYMHPEATTPLRPEVGTQPQFKKKKPPATYRFDTSIAPALDWDAQNSARDLGEWLIAQIDEASRLPSESGFQFPSAREFKNGRGDVVASVRSLADAVEQLKRMERPFLNWAGKAERLSFDVPTLPLFVHERLSTKAILETLKGHKRDRQMTMSDFFGDPEHSVTDQVLKAYEHQDKWQNRMILGDSLVVMNSLLKYEGLGEQVQMIYIDPPYNIKYGSNFQPFVRKRDVEHNDDDDMTREPETVKAYRDTWELGTHSYMTYLRDRLLLARDLLHDSGSVFVQINDDNVAIVRDVLCEVFGEENFVVTIVLRKKGNQKGELIDPVNDYILWAAKDKTRCRRAYTPLFTARSLDADLLDDYSNIELADGTITTVSELARRTGVDYFGSPRRIEVDFPNGRLFDSKDLTIGGVRKNQSVLFTFQGKTFDPGLARGLCWKHTATAENESPSGMDRLAAANRIFIAKHQIRFKRYVDDFPFERLSNLWTDLGGAKGRVYAVQTNTEAVKRCMLMTSRPGDLVLDPTCGSGTTAYVAEQWGRRWITVDTSRVPLALARQRLLTATFQYYELKDASRGPAGGFVYTRKQNNKGEEVGGIVPHITSSSIANCEPPTEEVLVDRPEPASGKITRVSGPFVVEGTIPTPIDWDNDGETDTVVAASQVYGSFVDRMIEVLRRSPVLHIGGNKTVNLRNVRPPAKTLSLSAEALADDFSHAGVVPTQGHLSDESRRKAVAILFGPENGAVSEKAVYEAAREARAKDYAHLYVIGFAIQPNARKLIDDCEAAIGVPATYVQATPDLMMGDLLKNMRSSQIFSVCGLPEVSLRKADGEAITAVGGDPNDKSAGPWYQAELLGLDVFDPSTMKVDHRPGADVPCWMLDSDYNGLCFKATQVFFPRTAAWDDLKRALKSEYSASVWEHLAGTTSTPFQFGVHAQVAAKVIDDRGNELMVVKSVKEAQR